MTVIPSGFQTDPALAPTHAISVALVGNPNCGKTTLFNRLTGTHQRTGNYPGVTVEKKSGEMKLDRHRTITLLDLPGTYSLAAASADERIVVDVLTGRVGPRPDAVVCVVDATNLMRHLFLASQVADTGVPIVLALNMIDAARERGIAIDTRLLSERLGVPVVSTVAAKGQGMDELRSAISAALVHGACLTAPTWPQAVTDAIELLHRRLPADAAGDLVPAELQRLIFDHDSAVADRLPWSAAQARQNITEARQLLKDAGLDPFAVEPMVRYARLAQLIEGVITRPTVRKATGSESIDTLLTHRLWGLIIFLALMFGVFWSIYTGAGPLMDGIEKAFEALGEGIGSLSFIASRPMIHSMIVDGLIAGVGGVVVFLPQILILFFFIALLEDTGYMARAAFLMDKLFAWCGLNGKSFVPLLSSYACAIPGIMGARTIDNGRARLTTVLIAPLMSCSARLPVYVLLIGAFIEPRYGSAVAAALLFGMHLLGLAVGMPIAWLVNRVIFRVKRTPFVMEMPSYRVPQMRDVAWRMWIKGRDFLQTAGTVIFAMSVIIWALSYFPRAGRVADEARAEFVRSAALEQQVSQGQVLSLLESDENLAARLEHAIDGAYLEQSYLGRMGKAIQPIFAPAGFDWKITVGVVGSFPAREVIIATLGIVYNLGGDVDEEDEGLIATMKRATWPDGRPVFTIAVVLSVMVFFALCLQCGATVAVMGREVGWKWAVGAFIYMTFLAWAGAVLTYQISSHMTGSVV